MTHTFLLLCILYPQIVTTKSNPLIVNEGKLRFSQKLNYLSTTAKPESQYQSINQYRGVQTERPPSHFTQNLASASQQLQQLHPQSQQQILELIQKVLYNTQQSNQPTAMIIIAQPAYAPVNPVYGNPAQQLFNYFQGNPQARYQFVNGAVQAQPSQQYFPQPSQHIQSEASYSTSQPQYQTKIHPYSSQTTHMSPVQPSQTYNQQFPQHVPQSNQISQLTAQPYYSQYQVEARENHANYPALPPIITGFENFSPEQQEKIKAQLSAHFGAPLRPLTVGQKETESGSKYQLNTNEFVPSPQVKSMKSSSNIMDMSKKEYTKM
ncbi:transcription factor SPT20 homolog [Diorhabda sublineata]|uniref:transcription factor SPT20 homolog n=1 Tax=Diorhabda sublineata TaxID=1163346 RepID=UPI0024E0FA25|nr:transcription factor SPT20 homolog [Diorhabda sublineata]